MKKSKSLLSLLLVLAMLTGMFPAGATVSSDVPELDDPPVIEEPRNQNTPETFPEKPEDTAELHALTEPVSGTCGENLTWTLTTDGTLTISGTGEMEDYNWGTSPWSSYKDSIRCIIVEDGVTSVGEYAFASSFYLESVTFGENVMSIGRYAFVNCYALTDVTLSEALETLGDYVFERCYALADITLPEALETVGYGAFWQCTSLMGITIPVGVTSLDDLVFNYCTNLTEIKVDSGNENYCSVDGVLFSKDMEKLLTYPAGKAGKSYTIPAGVKRVASYAFRVCTNLTSVTVSSGVKNIASDAFDDCTSLAEIRVDSNNEYFCSVDGILFSKDMETFYQYPAAKTGDSYTIPASVTYVSAYAFSDCVNLKNVTIPATVTGFDSSAFSECTSLERVDLPEGMTTIVNFMFGDCPNLVDVTIPDSVTVIESLAFYYCESLPGITIPAGVESIGEKAFDGCDSLTEITVKEGNQYYSSVDGVLFDEDQTTLIQYPTGKATSSYTIPDGVESIGIFAFSGCNLVDITIPVSVTSIGYYAFGYNNYNSTLKAVRYAGTEEQWNAITIEGANGLLTSATILFLADIGDTIASGTCGDDLDWVLGVDGTLTITGTGDMDDFDYYNAWQGTGGAPWVEHRALINRGVIADGVTSIGENSFSYCEALGEIVIPDSVTVIGEYAFSQCTSLASIELPAGVTSISDYTFSNCTSLAEIVFLGEITYIGSGAFSYCKSLESFVIPSGVTFVGLDAFIDCTSLAEIAVDSGNPSYCSVDGVLFTKDMTTLIKYPGAKAGTTYVIPDTVTSLDSGAFSACVSLESITIPDSVTWMGGSVFKGCSSLESIVIPYGVTSIGFSAFMYCYNLASVTIPNSVMNIAGQAFLDCESLEDIVIPASVTNISHSAFCGCSSLKSIVIPDGVPELGMQMFNGCESLESIVIPASVTSIGDNTFWGCSSLKTVYFTGTEEQWNAITIGTRNDELTSANIICNWDQNAGPVVTGSVDPATGKPMLTWDEYPGAEKYEIFRCDTADGTYIRMTTVTGTTYTNGTAVAGKTYYYKVRAVVGSSYSPSSAVVKVTCTLAAPVVTASVNVETGKPTFTWRAVSGAEKYEIFRCDTADGTYIRMTTVTGKTYTNGSAVAGKTYYYKIRAVAGTVSGLCCEPIKVTCAAPAALATPVVTASTDPATGKPMLTWNAVKDAEQYEIFRCDTPNGQYIRMYTTTETTYTNGSAVVGKTYYYKVRAVKGTSYSASSTVVKASCSLAAPVVTASVNAETGKPTLTWKAVSGAEKYEIFRCDTANGTYIRMTTVTGTTYTNGSAVTGKTYYYKVRAVVGTVNGVCCTPVAVTCAAPAALTAPVVKASVNAATGKPTLTWKAVAGAEQYEIFRCDTPNGQYIRMYTTTATTYTNGSAVAGKTYYYKVRAVKGTTNSPCSEVLTVTCAPAAPVVTSSVNAATGKPTLTWKAVAGAEKYEIFRCDTANGTYIRMTTVTGTTYTNGSAVAGKTYYYKVRAVVGTVNGACSEVLEVTCAAPAVLTAPVVKASVNAATGKPTLTWNAVVGAEKYEIFRCDTANGTYIRMYTTTATTYSNGSAVAGKTYYYKVRAVKGTTNGPCSEVLTVTCAPAAPVVTSSVDAKTGKPTLTWSAVAGAEKYEIFRCDTANGTYIRMYTTTETTYSNGSAVAGKTYYYKVRAVVGNVNGACSAVHKVTCAAPATAVSAE